MWWMLRSLLACAQVPLVVTAEPSRDPASIADVPATPAAPAEPSPRDPTEPRYAATELLVSWDGALDAPPGMTRTRDAAFALARALQSRARSGEDLAILAAEGSDDALKARGGHLGVYLTGTMDATFERAVAGVAPGEIGPIADTAFGFYVVRRESVALVRVGQIQVSFLGNWRSGATRSREDAELRIAAAIARLEAGETLSAVAAEISEKGTADADLGTLTPGQFIPAIESAVRALPPRGRSGVIESPYGLHVVVRLD